MKQEDWTEQLRNRLADHEEPVASDLWNVIEAQVDMPRHRHHVWHRWAAAAAVVLLLSGGALLLWKAHGNSPVPNSSIAVAKVEQPPLSSRMEQTVPASIPAPPSASLVPEPPTASGFPELPEVPEVPLAPELPLVSVVPLAPELPELPLVSEVPEAPELPEAPLVSELPEAPSSPDPSPRPSSWGEFRGSAPRTKTSLESPRLTAALYAENGLAGQRSTTPVQMSMAMAQRFSTQPGNYGVRGTTPIWLTGYEEQTHHQLPVSLGLTFSLPVGHRLAVGTGIVYSCLQSDFTTVMKGWQVTRQQTLHYVGVPLNLHYTLLPLGRFNLYASAGVQADFNVLSRLKTNNTEVDGQKDRCQWSLHGNVGLSYSLAPCLALYAEPGIRHMIDNHSSIQNYYKDKPTSLTLQLGLRLTLGE